MTELFNLDLDILLSEPIIKIFILFILLIVSIILIKYGNKTLSKILKIKNSHKSAHTGKTVLDAKHNEIRNMNQAINNDENLKEQLHPILNIDDKDLKTVVMMNNVNYIAIDQNNGLVFTLNAFDIDPDSNRTYIFATDNYNVYNGYSLSENIYNSNFPKNYNGDEKKLSIVKLKDIGYKGDVVLKAETITALVFNGKKRMLTILTNNKFNNAYFIRYKSKKNMVEKIKNTPELYNHIMQWGIGGYKDSFFFIMNNENNLEDDGENHDQ